MGLVLYLHQMKSVHEARLDGKVANQSHTKANAGAKSRAEAIEFVLVESVLKMHPLVRCHTAVDKRRCSFGKFEPKLNP